jgi:hypothetical protein
MIGPIFGLELRQDRSRGRRFYLLPWAYAALLAFQVALSPWWVIGYGPGRGFEESGWPRAGFSPT